MSTEVATLYKLMILYMLSKVNFPLSNTQISEFMLGKQYTTYFVFQESIHSLIEDNFISPIAHQGTTQYKLTKEGEDAIAFFYTKISAAIRADIDQYLAQNKYDLKSEAGTTSDYYRSTDGSYIVHCQVKEGDTKLIELNLSVPLEEQAESMCAKWKDASQDIYEYVIHGLM